MTREPLPKAVWFGAGSMAMAYATLIGWLWSDQWARGMIIGALAFTVGFLALAGGLLCVALVLERVGFIDWLNCK